MRERSQPCLNFQMGRCLAPCAGRVDAADYQRMVRDVLLILEGRTDQVVGELTAKMEQAAEALRFEQAAVYRDQIGRSPAPPSTRPLSPTTTWTRTCSASTARTPRWALPCCSCAA